MTKLSFPFQKRNFFLKIHKNLLKIVCYHHCSRPNRGKKGPHLCSRNWSGGTVPQTHLTVQVGYGVHVLAAGAASRHRRATPAPPGPAPGLWEPSRGGRKTDPGGCVRATPVRMSGVCRPIWRRRFPSAHPSASHRTKNWQCPFGIFTPTPSWGIKELM